MAEKQPFDPRNVGLTWAYLKREQARNERKLSPLERLVSFTKTLAIRAINRERFSKKGWLAMTALLGGSILLLSILEEEPLADKARAIQDAKDAGVHFGPVVVPADQAISLREEIIRQSIFDVERAEKLLIGKSDDEISRQIWQAAIKSGYKFGPLYTYAGSKVLEKDTTVLSVPIDPSNRFFDENILGVIFAQLEVTFMGQTTIVDSSGRTFDFALLDGKSRLSGNLGERANKVSQWLLLSSYPYSTHLPIVNPAVSGK